MPVVNVHEAKTQLSRLLAQVEAGEEVVIADPDHPVIRIAHVIEVAACGRQFREADHEVDVGKRIVG